MEKYSYSNKGILFSPFYLSYLSTRTPEFATGPFQDDFLYPIITSAFRRFISFQSLQMVTVRSHQIK